jgi:hypothetical protein
MVQLLVFILEGLLKLVFISKNLSRVRIFFGTQFVWKAWKAWKDGRVGRLSAKSSPVNGFSCKAHADLRSCIVEECKCRMTKEGADTKL